MPEAHAAERQTGPRSRGRSLSWRALPALVAYLGIRLLGVLALWFWSQATSAPRKAPHVLFSHRWDSLWYSRIAQHGYGYSVRTHSGDLHSDLAFFPLLPALERAGHDMTGLAVSDVGLGVSVLASLCAAMGIFALTELMTTDGRWVGIRAVVRGSDSGDSSTSGWERLGGAPFVVVVLWGALPVGVVEWMAYSESLFTALAAWSLYCVLSRRWVTAGVLASAAGLTRPVGVGVVLAVWVGAAVAASRAGGSGGRAGGGCEGAEVGSDGLSAGEPPRRAAVRTAVGVLLAPLGLAGYVLWVAHRMGRGLTGYLDIQSGWRNGFDGGLTFARFVAAKFTSPGGAVAGIGLILGVGVAVWAVVACFRDRRVPAPVLVYVVVLVALALGAKGYFGSKPRFFVPIFPLLFPLASWLAARPSRRGVLVGLGALVLVSTAFGVVWLNGSGPP